MGAKSSKVKDANGKETYKSGIQHKRRCTDCFFLLLFIIFWIGMFIVAGFALKSGNPQKLKYPTDVNGDMCGKPAGNSWSNPNKNDRENTTLLFYPIDFRPQNLIDLEKSLAVLDMGICVKKCPVGFGTDLDWTAVFSNISAWLDPNKVDDFIVCNYANQNASASDKISMALEAFTSNSAVLNCFIMPFPTTNYFGLNRCLPDTNIIVKYLNGTNLGKLADLSSFTNAATFFDGVADSFFSTWKVILISFAVAIVLCFVWILLLRLLVGVIAWISIIALFLVLATLTGACLYLGITKNQTATTDSSKKWAYGYIAVGSVLAALTFIYFCLVIWMIKRIVIAIEIIKEASKAFMKLPGLIFIPPVVFLCIACLTAYFLFVAMFIQTSSRPIELDATRLAQMPYVKIFSDNIANATNTTIPSSITLQANNVTIQCLQIIHLFGYFWAVALVIAIGYTSIAGAVAGWYFSKHGDKKTPERFAIIKSVGRVLRYHLGSLALGSLIVAIVQILRVLFRRLEKYLAKKGGPVASKVVLIVGKIIHCCLWCLEKLIKFINKNAYIMIAIHGSNFCSSAQRAFKLLLENILRVGAVNALGTFLLFLGKIAISIGSSVVCIVLIYFANADNTKYKKGWGKNIVDESFEIEYFFVPVIVVVLFSFFMATVFMDVYDTAIDTILLCFCEDLDVNDGTSRPYYMPTSLKRMIDKRGPMVTQSEIDPAAAEAANKMKKI